ncbi:Copal-8-ol diphosphate hydratase [Handroanthus impetiginosus]|uniref:Copal-8-ol diphosphate hydratase n=1 Tax=Handroanthus impetiginosus TaxID=429701 RepID=A0A2G9H485_9LAMI|nr:Copal-8-ol diphosphate hydratase [Handroanthus impetiginosus]
MYIISGQPLNFSDVFGYTSASSAARRGLPMNSCTRISSIKENISKLGDANFEHMTCGFEVVFPALLERAKRLGIDGIPYDAPVVQEICAVRDRKMERVPKESLLYNLEGLENLDWPKILKLQTPKGSIFASPAATSFAVVETKDENCLKFIRYVVNKFNGGAPTVYPVDIFARLWAVDHLQRLGISRFFEPEIRNCLDHVDSYWTQKGVFSARGSEFCDTDDTSMGFRLLRLHGYNISPDALSNFKKDNEFTFSPSQIFNLYRASEVQFPGEIILEEAREFSYNVLQERLEKSQLLDNCLISKHLPNEIKNGLDVPWYASLPRVEARFYIENYGVDDIWIGKSLYRMPEINNETYLELAKLDYNRCQAQHQIEWNHTQKWYEDSNLEEFGISKKDLLLVFFLATASIFEPEKSGERTAWVKSQILSNILLTYYFIKEAKSSDQTTTEFGKNISNIGRDTKGYKNVQRIISILFEALTEFKKDAKHQISTDISDLLHEAWGAWLKKLGEGAEDQAQEVELLVRIINICGGRIASKDILCHQEYKTLSELTNKICHQLQKFENEKVIGMEGKKAKYREIERDIQLLVQFVLQDSPAGISKDIKQTFFVVVKTFYYRAYFTAEQIENHVSKVLFEQVG